MRDLTVKTENAGEITQNVVPVSAELSQPLSQLSAVVTCLRTELNKDLPIQHVALLLAVLQQPGISMQGLMEHLAMPQGSVSRNVKLLADSARGYGLLRTTQSQMNRKQVVVEPTEKCVHLFERICQFL
jgi:DNA-binding MarR family transcriptional regulator